MIVSWKKKFLCKLRRVARFRLDCPCINKVFAIYNRNISALAQTGIGWKIVINAKQNWSSHFKYSYMPWVLLKMLTNLLKDPCSRAHLTKLGSHKTIFLISFCFLKKFPLWAVAFSGWKRNNETFCTIWYYFHNVKNVKNTHWGVLLLVRLQASAYTFTKSNTPSWVFFTFFKLYKWYQIAQSITHELTIPFIMLTFQNFFLEMQQCKFVWCTQD